MTLAEVYRDAGYATVAYSSVLFTGKFSNMQQGFEELHESSFLEEQEHPSKTARDYVDRLSAWLELHQEVPFFVFLHLFDPHDPFKPRPPYDAIWADPTRVEEHERLQNQARQFTQDALLKVFGMPSRADLEAAGIDADAYAKHDIDWYDGSIRGMDAEIGRLLEKLRMLGLADRTVVAFTSDHGEEFLDHGRMFHGQTVYGELTQVPLILWRPGTLPAGLVIEDTVQSIDLMPTLLEISQLPLPEFLQGQSLLPLVAASRDVASAARSSGSVAEAAVGYGWKPVGIISEKAQTSGFGNPPPHETASLSIILEGWKLIHNAVRAEGTPEYELYDHRQDPLDRNNLAEANPEIVERLATELASWREMALAAQLPEGTSLENLSPEELQRLRSLGYIR